MKENNLFDILLKVSELKIDIETGIDQIFLLADEYDKTLDMNNSWDRHKARGVLEFLEFIKG